MNQYPPQGGPLYQQEPPQQTKTITIHPRFFLFLGLFVVVIVALVLLFSNGGGNRSYATAEMVNDDSHYSGEVVIVRDEKLVDAETFSRIEFVADEGAMIYKGDLICQVYSAGYNQNETAKLVTYRDDIKEYHKLRMSDTLMDTQLDKINNDIKVLAEGVKMIVQGRAMGNLNNLEAQLAVALSDRQTYLQQKYPDEQNLISLYDKETQQLRKIESWTTSYTATDQSLVSFYTDGYENTVNMASFDELTAQQARDVLAGVLPESDAVSRGRKAIYRTIEPTGWGVLMISRHGQWTPSVGQVYNLQLEGYSDIVHATVRSSVRAGNDILVRLDVVNTSVSPVLNIRTSRAVIGNTLNGIRVPIDALFTQQDSSGNLLTGVVTSDGGYETFVPTQVISRTDTYAIVTPVYEGTLQAGQRVKLFSGGQ